MTGREFLTPFTSGEMSRHITARNYSADCEAYNGRRYNVATMGESAKKWFFRSAGFGAGFALALAIIVATSIWYSDRPKQPKPWNTNAITAEFDRVTTEGDENTFLMYYTLVNNTNEDYRLRTDPDVDLMLHLSNQNSIVAPTKDNKKYITAEYPLFVPPHGRSRFAIHFWMRYPEKPKSGATEDERYNYSIQAAKYLVDTVKNIDGFVLYDNLNRYQISLPNGWKDEARKALRPTSSSSNGDGTR